MTAAAKAAATTYELAKKQGWIDRLVGALKKKHSVLVLGSTGVGKSNFLNSLSQELPEAIDILNRTVANEKGRLTVKSSIVDFIDTPGELGLRGKRVQAYRELLGKENTGVINVVSFGYHEYPVGARLHPLTTRKGASPSYLRRHRDIEIEAVREWKNTILTPASVKWQLTVATKADLWWDKATEVLDYYANGTYAREFDTFHWLSASVVPHCSVIHRFYSDGLVSGLFDDNVRTTVRANTLQRILSLISE
jgi:energy-coupling factor transporter ATP-binding protein EcfA2